MFRLLSRRKHGYADYSYIPTVAILPELAGFSHLKVPSALCRASSFMVFVSSFFTRAEWGVVRIMPYKTHLMLDAANGALALSAPWLFGFARHRAARNAFIGMGLISLTAFALSRKQNYS